MKAKRDFLMPSPADQPAWLRIDAGQINLLVHVQPGAKRTRCVGEHGERLKIAVAAPPLEGRANAAAVEFIAERLGVPKSAVAVASGAHSRDKRVAVDGCALSAAQVVARLRD